MLPSDGRSYDAVWKRMLYSKEKRHAKIVISRNAIRKNY